MDGNSKKLILFLLGNISVGKTAFVNEYVNDIYEEYKTTIGVDFYSKALKLETGEQFNLIFYDTAGQERYRAFSFNLIKNANGILLMYDITNRKTFDDINQWLESIKEAKGDNFPIVLIGNKCDLTEERQISTEEGEKSAKDNGFSFIEVSCKEGINIEESVKILVNIIENKKKGTIERN